MVLCDIEENTSSGASHSRHSVLAVSSISTLGQFKEREILDGLGGHAGAARRRQHSTHGGHCLPARASLRKFYAWMCITVYLHICSIRLPLAAHHQSLCSSVAGVEWRANRSNGEWKFLHGCRRNSGRLVHVVEWTGQRSIATLPYADPSTGSFFVVASLRSNLSFTWSPSSLGTLACGSSRSGMTAPWPCLTPIAMHCC